MTQQEHVTLCQIGRCVLWCQASSRMLKHGCCSRAGQQQHAELAHNCNSAIRHKQKPWYWSMHLTPLNLAEACFVSTMSTGVRFALTMQHHQVH
jgi:hypothetical protein